MSKKLNILFRTAGGRAKNGELGLGHIYRCINLSQHLKKHSIHFLIEDYGDTKKVLKENQIHNISTMKNDVDLNNDIKKTVDLIKRKKIDVLIIDRFKTKKKYVSLLKKFVKTIVISDLKIVDYDADLLINGFIGFQNKIFTNRYGTKCFVGPKYQILNKGYIHKSSSKKRQYDLLITLGGFDDKRITDIVCQRVIKYLDKIKVILGPATIKSKTIKKLESKFKGRLIIHSKTKDMKKEILDCKFGICGGGITSYEFAAMGIPFAIICQYKHQLQTASEWESKRIGLNLGMPNKNLGKKIDQTLQSYVQGNLSVKAKKNIIDGFGARRVAKIIIS